MKIVRINSCLFHIHGARSNVPSAECDHPLSEFFDPRWESVGRKTGIHHVRSLNTIGAERERDVKGSLDERLSPKRRSYAQNFYTRLPRDYALPVAAGQPSDPSGPGRLRSHHDQSSGINENGSL